MLGFNFVHAYFFYTQDYLLISPIKDLVLRFLFLEVYYV